MHGHTAPDPDDIDEARTAVADDLAGVTASDHNWSTPELTEVRTALVGAEVPIALTTSNGDAVLLKHVDITEGRPRHGALMSATHISGFEAVIPQTCETCGNRLAVIDYSRHHNIAGGYSLVCEQCGEVLESDEWG